MTLNSLWTLFWAMILCPVLPCLIYFITITDVLLSGSSSFIFLTCALIFIASSFVNLSAVASLRIKELALDIPIDMLSDSDLESEDERDGVVPLEEWSFTNIPLILRNFIAFSTFYFSYGIISAVGSVCLIAALVLVILSLSIGNDTVTQEELWHIFTLLMIPGIALPTVVVTIANRVDLYIEDTSYLKYNTFDSLIRVPMKVIAGRTFAAFLLGGYKYILQFGFGIVLFVYGLYASLSLIGLSEDDIRQWQHATQVGNIRFILASIMISAVMAGIFLVLRVTKHSYEKAKYSLLVTMEDNWQRNLTACELLVPESRSTTLGTLRTSIQTKARRNSLTEKESQALEYLSLPLWKPKRPFT